MSDIDELLAEGPPHFTRRDLRCPASNPPPAADTAVAAPSSYIYLGRGLHLKDVRPDMVLAYEVPGQHRSGISAMFGDELALEQDRLAAAFPRGRRESDLLLEREGKG